MKDIFLFAAASLVTLNLHAQSPESRIQSYIDSFYHANPKTTGIMVHVSSPRKNLSWTYAAGICDKTTDEKLSVNQPVLIASNTKTYVAATILKLVEQHKLQLNEPIDALIRKDTRDLLADRGYKTKDITLKHLLSHTSGIDDYVNDDYTEFVNNEPWHAWKRSEQIQLAMKVGGPLGQPGDTFKYADVNYLLLTEVIEKCTGKDFYRAMRELLDFKGHHLDHTWFVKLEKKPAGTKPLAHQYWNKYNWDSYNLDPSWDLYGGGGMAATPADLADFFLQLFEGKIIKDREVLAAMYGDVPCKTPTTYRVGIRKLTMAGLVGYYHGGFWGTDAIYFPDLDAAISIVILEKSERDLSASICTYIESVLK